MNNSIVINLIKRLPTRDLSKFKEYIDAPFFNKRDKLKLLLELILKSAPSFRATKLDKKKLYAAIFKEKAYDELKINNLASNLLSHLYDFLALRQYQKNTQLQKQLLINELLEREIHDHVDRTARTYFKNVSDSPVRNFEYFHSQYEIHDQLDQHFLTKGIRAYDEHLQLKSDFLDKYYIANKLRIAVDMTSRNFVSKAGYTSLLTPQLLDIYEKDQLNVQEQPAISIYYKILQLMNASQQAEKNEDGERYYQELKTLLSEKLEFFPIEELRVIYLYLQNYCIYQINSGKSEYYQEILYLYQFLLDKRIIFKNGYLSQWAYKNIVTVGIRLQDFNWTEQVIHQFKENLLPGERTNALAYNLAAFYYAKKEYKNALQQLHNVEFTDNSYHLGAKIIQLKSYYETDEYSAFFALVEAFRKYVRRNKELADYRRSANLHFLKIASQIYTLRLKKKTLRPVTFKTQYSKIETNLNELPLVANKDWLLQILKRL